MKKRNNVIEEYLSLLINEIWRFLCGSLGSFIILQLANSFSQTLQIVLKGFGYGIYFYWVTPLVILWLGFLSADKLTSIKLILTVLLVGVYSYILWDCYFFLFETIKLIVSY